MPTEMQPGPAALYARHYLELVRLARQLVDDVETAEDVVQDVFAALADKRLPDDPVRYLRRGVVNRSRSVLRRRRTVRAYAHRPVDPAGAADPADAELLRSEEARAVLAAVAALPRRQREVVVLRFYADLSVAEAAAVLGIRAGAVTTSLRRALASLPALIERPSP
ncbi:MAG: sigma-70 family RNA polymerase sigma factor [Jatrophihabitans sp.]|uniref:sigma-70 family RNA polymerase sigma factor n=1 Tax=Jatrophihabitans sp. TaxID=1932789 RepID=UPI003912F1DB